MENGHHVSITDINALHCDQISNTNAYGSSRANLTILLYNLTSAKSRDKYRKPNFPKEPKIQSKADSRPPTY